MNTDQKLPLRYHLIFWVLYTAIWSARDLIYHDSFINNLTTNAIFNLVLSPLVYLNLNYLIPKYLLPKKWSQYAIAFMLTFMLALVIRFYLYQGMFTLVEAQEAKERFASLDGVVILFSENIFLYAITTALFIINEWFRKERYAHDLEKKNTATELHLLKAQLQPHYLFNNLNTIYFLMEKNPSLAKEVMIRFSEMLSHQLYNVKKDFVPLKEEIENLKNYIQLQQIRHEDFVTIRQSIADDVAGLVIAPMILLTFVENAFKHGQREQGYDVDIVLTIEDRKLSLKVKNTIGETLSEKGGVGLENVKRRLALIYPGKHTLDMSQTADIYSIALTLALDKNG